jgi:cytidine deaminase
VVSFKWFWRIAKADWSCQMPAKPERKTKAGPDPDLLEAAKRAAGNAYAPYSRFCVGCAVRTSSGKIHVGCNLESESFPAGMCAERAALAAAVAAEGEKLKVDRILVYATGVDGHHTSCSPCGVCRQVIYEVAADATVGFFAAGNEFVETAAVDLLPWAFRGHLR